MELSDNKKTYISQTGASYPRITNVINDIIGFDFSCIAKKYLEQAIDFGNNIHSMISLDIKGILDESKLTSDMIKILDSWRDITREYKFIASEMVVFYDRAGMKFAGTLDIVADINGEITLIDIKTSAVVVLHTCGPQTAAYQKAYNNMDDNKEKQKITKRGIFQIKSERDIKYYTLKNKRDYDIFLNCLNLYNWKNNKY